MNTSIRQPYADEKALLQGLKEDNSLAWKQLLKNNTSNTKYRIKRVIRNPEDAEEVFNDTLLTFSQRIKSPSFELSSKLDTFLSGIAFNKIGEYIRRLGLRGVFVDIDETAYNELAQKDFIDYTLKNDNEDEKNIIKHIIENEMTEKCRDIIKAFHYDDKSDAEAFEELGYNNQATLRVSRHNCMARFIEMAKEKLKNLK